LDVHGGSVCLMNQQGERSSSEVLLALDQTRLRTNRIKPREGCLCEDYSFWGRGDVEPFLEMVWPTDTK
jgi:hypothetical protein